MIVRNEEANLEACLAPVRGLVSEIVIVDTGSIDRTVEIARAHGARVFDFRWVDDFSAARNASLSHAIGDWVFWLDADDRLDAANVAQLQSLFASLGARDRYYRMTCASDQPGLAATHGDSQVRLFPRLPGVRWKYRVHEQVEGSLTAQGVVGVDVDVRIRHVGYLDDAIVQRKINRDFRLLRLDYLAHPDDPSVLIHLARNHTKAGQTQQALSYLEHARRLFEPPADWGRMLFRMLAQTWRRLADPDASASVCEEGLHVFPDDAGLLLQRAVLFAERNGLAEAIPLLERAIDASRRSAECDDAQAEAQRILGIVHQRRGDFDAGLRTLHRLVATAPHFLPGLIALAELQVVCDRAGFAETVGQVTHYPGGATYAKVLEGQRFLLDSDFATAERLLDDAIAEAPPSLVWPRWVRLQLSLARSDRLEDCLAQCRDIVRRCPDHGEAQTLFAALEREQALRAARQTASAGQFVVCGIG